MHQIECSHRHISVANDPPITWTNTPPWTLFGVRMTRETQQSLVWLLWSIFYLLKQIVEQIKYRQIHGSLILFLKKIR